MPDEPTWPAPRSSRTTGRSSNATANRPSTSVVGRDGFCCPCCRPVSMSMAVTYHPTCWSSADPGGSEGADSKCSTSARSDVLSGR